MGINSTFISSRSKSALRDAVEAILGALNSPRVRVPAISGLRRPLVNLSEPLTTLSPHGWSLNMPSRGLPSQPFRSEVNSAEDHWCNTHLPLRCCLISSATRDLAVTPHM